MNTDFDIRAGGIVKSISGRDKGRCYIVLEVLKDGFVLVVDGKYRTLDKPKKKNRKHLQKYNKTQIDLSEEFLKGSKLENSHIRECLKKLPQS